MQGFKKIGQRGERTSVEEGKRVDPFGKLSSNLMPSIKLAFKIGTALS